MTNDWQVTVVLLVLACLIFNPETAVNVCAIIWGLFFLKRWLSND
jgi:hypothetical protein